MIGTVHATAQEQLNGIGIDGAPIPETGLDHLQGDLLRHQIRGEDGADGRVAPPENSGPPPAEQGPPLARESESAQRSGRWSHSAPSSPAAAAKKRGCRRASGPPW